MEKLKEENPNAYQYLQLQPAICWAQHAFPAPRYGHITSNIAKLINATWEEDRNLPAFQLIISTWTKVMTTIHRQRTQMHTSHHITDYA